MWTAFLILIAVVAVVLLTRLKPKTRENGSTWELQARDLMNSTEKKFFRRLEEALPDHTVLAQVALSQLFKRPAHQKGGGSWNKVDRKVLDFVICDADMKIVACVEIDGPTHRGKNQQQRDADKSAALAAAGYRLLRFSTDQLPTGQEIREAVGIRSIENGNDQQQDAAGTGRTEPRLS